MTDTGRKWDPEKRRWYYPEVDQPELMLPLLDDDGEVITEPEIMELRQMAHRWAGQWKSFRDRGGNIEDGWQTSAIEDLVNLAIALSSIVAAQEVRMRHLEQTTLIL